MNLIVNGVMEKINRLIVQRATCMTENQFAAEIKEWKASPRRGTQIKGSDYYKGRHEILNRQRLAIGRDGKLVPVENLPNNKLIDNQYAKAVDQKVNYFVGNRYISPAATAPPNIMPPWAGRNPANTCWAKPQTSGWRAYRWPPWPTTPRSCCPDVAASGGTRRTQLTRSAPPAGYISTPGTTRAGGPCKGVKKMKDTICTAIGIIGGVIASLFGGWDTALQTLVIFMAIDYITGLVVAGVFHASPKTKTGALESKAGWKGLIRKGETLLIVLVACQLDAVIGGSFVRDAAIIGFSANEAISIVENAGLMGLPIPAAITKAIDILKQRAETPEKGKD